jgi:hypothetical protein
MEALLFKIHLLFSLYMLGLIWFVQVVHYPLFAKIKPDNFVAYENQHTHKTGFVTAAPMLVELVTAVLLLYFNVESTFYWLNILGVLALWASTFFIQVPLHGRLSQQYDGKAIQQLVRSNWIRTIIWTVRGLALVFLF